MVDVVSSGTSSIVLFLVFMNTGFVVKIFLDYPGISSARLVIISLLINVWAFTGSLFFFVAVLPENTGAVLTFLHSIGLFCLFSGLTGLAAVLNKTLHGKPVRFLINSSAVLYAMDASLAVADLCLERPVFFAFAVTPGTWRFDMHPFSILLTLLAVVLTAVSVFASILVANPVREYFLGQQKRFKKTVLTAFFLFLAMLPAGFAGTVIFHVIPLTIGFAANMLSVLGLFSITFYMFATQPLFLLLSGANPDVFLKQGYTGYFLGVFADDGPGPALVSAECKSRLDLSELALLHLNLKVLTVAGTDSSARFQRVAAVIHVPVTDNINALGVYFNSNDPEAKDPRLRRNSPVVFGVLFPVVLNKAFHHIFDVLPIVLEQVSLKTVPELKNSFFLENLARMVLKKLLE
ncbi:MAG: hypothetical protein ACFFD4_35310 [Candidatus Odinarchaeota archaeon]